MLSTTKFISNPDRDETVVVHEARFDGLIDIVGQMRNEGGHGTKDMRLVAYLPGIVIEQYCFQNGVSWPEFWADKKHIKKMLNDRDLSYFRVAPGKV